MEPPSPEVVLALISASPLRVRNRSKRRSFALPWHSGIGHNLGANQIRLAQTSLDPSFN
jgi:hypothetical protein